jgi:hypothetical protein
MSAHSFQLLKNARIQQEHRKKIARLACNEVADIRNSLAKCPRELVHLPARSISMPPGDLTSSHSSVTIPRLRAWFHLRAQQANGGVLDENLCSEDEERYQAFASRVGLTLSNQELESPCGMEDMPGIMRSFARVRSLPPSAPSELYPPITVQRLRRWYHLYNGLALSQDSFSDPHAIAVVDRAFIRFAFKLGLDMADLEDMDLPVVADPDDHSASATVQTTSTTATITVSTSTCTNSLASAQMPSLEGSAPADERLVIPSEVSTSAAHPNCTVTERLFKRPRDHEYVHRCSKV